LINLRYVALGLGLGVPVAVQISAVEALRGHQ